MTSPREKMILIVDDSATIIHVLSHILKTEGFQFSTAGNGSEAIAFIEKTPPDAIIMDLMMPGQGGFDVLRQLQTAEYSKIPIVMISARKPDPSTISMLEQESNVVGFLGKPVDAEDLAFLLHRVLKTDRLPPESQGRTSGK